MIYLDNAATTKIDASVFKTMLPYLRENYGNPGALYKLGRDAKNAINLARSQVANLFGAEPENIIFTSSGSEGNNLVIKGLADHLKSIGKTHILVSAVEHDSVLEAANSLIKQGFYVEQVPVTREGYVQTETVEKLLRPETGLVSVMHSNNETGACNPVSEIAGICRKRDVLFHTDCVQAAGFYCINMKETGADFATISAHKIHGPKGAGAICAMNPGLLSSQISGGGSQEFGLRAGTENVAAIVGFGAACTKASRIREQQLFVSTLKQRFFLTFFQKLRESGADKLIAVNGPSATEPGKVLSLCVRGIDAQSLILMADTCGLCVSAGAACCSGENTPSHVLTAMGISDEDARSSVRISFSYANSTEREAVEAAEILAGCVKTLLSRTLTGFCEVCI